MSPQDDQVYIPFVNKKKQIIQINKYKNTKINKQSPCTLDSAWRLCQILL